MIAGTAPAHALAPEDLTVTDHTHVASANAWLDSQMTTGTDIVTASTIAPSTTYASNYLGAVDGIFALSGRTYAVENKAVIAVTTLATVADSYRGAITGTVLLPPTSWRWIIQAYKRTATATVQVPVQALADPVTGAFSIDLSPVSASIPGEWELGVLDASASYAPHGTNWPTPNTYVGIEVQQLLVTDAVYYWSSTPARAGGSFRFTRG